VPGRADQPQHPDPLPDQRPDPSPARQVAMQVLRAYPAKRPLYPFAPEGERSIVRTGRRSNVLCR
jgi:hypothetical protein